MGKNKKKKRHQPSPPRALEAMLSHFGRSDLTDLVTFKRHFPGTARADLQRVLEAELAEATLFGLVKQYQHEALKVADFLDARHMPVLIAPVQYEEIDVGAAEPLRCLVQGIWLLERKGQPLALLLSQSPRHEGPGLNIELAATPDSLNEARLLLDSIESALREATTYRGKVLSLEPADHYGGVAGTVRVHRLPPVRREQVILPEKTLRLLERNLHDFVRQRDKLRKLGMPLKKGLLFYGPPGTGKTHTIRYLAGQLPEHTTFLITAEQVGLLPHYVQFARFLQPAIVVIEDVDLIGRDRGEMSSCEEVLLNVLLNEMDGLREDAEILFLLTTNRPEELEFALSSRPGRVDQAIEFPLPDEEGRRKLLELYSAGLRVSRDTLENAVQRTKGASAAFIKELMRRGAQYFLRDGGKGELQEEHLDLALNEMVFDGGSLNLKLLGASQELQSR